MFYEIIKKTDKKPMYSIENYKDYNVYALNGISAY